MPQRNLIGTGRKYATCVSVTLMLGACSQLPDSINPVEWYNRSVDFFADRDNRVGTSHSNRENLKNVVKDRQKASPSAVKKYPTIASVDQQKDYYEARKRGGLVPDNENRNYAPAIARQGEISTRIADAPPSEPEAKDPEPGIKVISSKPKIKKRTIVEAPEKQLSLPTPAEQRTLKARLQERLNEIRARAGQPPTALLTSMGSGITSDNFGTVIINSQGATTAQVSVAIPATVEATKNSLTTNLPIKTSRLNYQTPPFAEGAVKVATIHFRNGSAALSSRDRQIIANALQLKKERGGRIHIIGHASSRTRSLDPLRHKMLNFKISVDRADAVARELIRLGVKKEELLVDAISDSQPMYFEFMPTGEAGNRRAEIYLES